MTPKILTTDEWQRLTQPERVDLGSYHSWNPVKKYQFIFELFAHQLAQLAEEAMSGRRVYEFMAIRRPGDVLRYLNVRVVELDPIALKSIREKSEEHTRDDGNELPFIDFDSCFNWDFDDTTPDACVWLQYRDSEYWRKQITGLLDIVRAAQSRLRQIDDYILQHELRLIDACRHRRDYWADWRIETHPRPSPCGQSTPVADELREAILELIRRDDIRSVSCPFTDFDLWRGLVAEQLKRADATGLPLQQAFCLCGPDSGVGEAMVEDWGGEVHIPYEGACGSDLFILPGWFRFSPEDARESGNFRWATGRHCNHILVRGDHGELACATRKRIGEWTLYSSTAPYEDCNPFYGVDAVNSSTEPASDGT